jgi:hypothetical protein
MTNRSLCRPLRYERQIMSGWASVGQTREESEETMTKLMHSEECPGTGS